MSVSTSCLLDVGELVRQPSSRSDLPVEPAISNSSSLTPLPMSLNELINIAHSGLNLREKFTSCFIIGDNASNYVMRTKTDYAIMLDDNFLISLNELSFTVAFNNLKLKSRETPIEIVIPSFSQIPSSIVQILNEMFYDKNHQIHLLIGDDGIYELPYTHDIFFKLHQEISINLPNFSIIYVSLITNQKELMITLPSDLDISLLRQYSSQGEYEKVYYGVSSLLHEKKGIMDMELHIIRLQNAIEKYNDICIAESIVFRHTIPFMKASVTDKIRYYSALIDCYGVNKSDKVMEPILESQKYLPSLLKTSTNVKRTFFSYILGHSPNSFLKRLITLEKEYAHLSGKEHEVMAAFKNENIDTYITIIEYIEKISVVTAATNNGFFSFMCVVNSLEWMMHEKLFCSNLINCLSRILILYQIFLKQNIKKTRPLFAAIERLLPKFNLNSSLIFSYYYVIPVYRSLNDNDIELLEHHMNMSMKNGDLNLAGSFSQFVTYFDFMPSNNITIRYESKRRIIMKSTQYFINRPTYWYFLLASLSSLQSDLAMLKITDQDILPKTVILDMYNQSISKAQYSSKILQDVIFKYLNGKSLQNLSSFELILLIFYAIN